MRARNLHTSVTLRQWKQLILFVWKKPTTNDQPKKLRHLRLNFNTREQLPANKTATSPSPTLIATIMSFLAGMSPELLEDVLRHLQPRDFQSLMCVDRAHHEAFQPLVFQTINATYKHLQSEQSLTGMNFDMFLCAHTMSFKGCASLELKEGDEPEVDKDIVSANLEKVLQHSNPEALLLYSCNITVRMCVTMGQMSNLVELSLIGKETSDNDVEIVCDNILQLSKLRIEGSHAITNNSLEKISSLLCLKELDVSFCTGLTLEGFPCLSRLSLLTLKMSGIATTGDLSGVSNIAAITTLCSLDISGNPIREHVSHLARLSNLSVLNVSDCLISDVGMKYVAKLDLLEKVYLSGNDITDLGLLSLIRLNHLQEVDVNNCKGIRGKYFTFKDSLMKVLYVPFKPVLRCIPKRRGRQMHPLPPAVAV